MTKIKEFVKNHKIIVTCCIILALLVVSVLTLGWIGLWYDALIGLMIGVCLTDVKKHGLPKILIIVMLLIILLTNILPGRQNMIDRIGVFDIFYNWFSIVLANFGYMALYAFVIGGFYGVLNKIPSYKKLLDNIVKKVKPYSKRFIFVTIILFAVISSLTGMVMQLFIFVPFVVAIILLLGYDKLVALSATVVSSIIGYIGGVFATFINPNTGVNTTFETFIGLDSKLANTFPKLLLLFAGVVLLIFFVNKHIKNVEEKKVKYELSDNSELQVTEVKGNYKDIKTWPLIVILVCTFIVLVLGLMPWNPLFEIKVFSDFHTWLTGLSIKDFAVVPNVISKNLVAFGAWNGSGNPLVSYVYISLLLVFVTFVIALVNKVKINDAIDNFVSGMKKALPAAATIMLAYTVLVCAYNNGFYELVISNYGKFNYGISSLLAFGGCILNVDTTWIIIGVFSPIINLITDEGIYESVAILLQGIYGTFLLVGPTSLVLILGLTYFDIPYTTWLKYIWRFILYLIVLLSLVTFLVTLM